MFMIKCDVVTSHRQAQLKKKLHSFFVIKLKLTVLTKVDEKPVNININRIMKLEAINEKIIYKTL